MKITKRTLQAKGACPNQVAVFAKEWPRGAMVTLKNCERAAKLGLNVHWVSKNLLPKNLYDAYEARWQSLDNAYVTQWQSLDAAYEAQWKPLDDAYWAQRKALCDAYDAQRQSLDDAYDAQRKSLYAAYEAQLQPLCDAYETQCWQVFYKITKGA